MRDLAVLQNVVAEGVVELGRLDIVVANAGIPSSDLLYTMDESIWQEMIDINLTGVWKTVRATVPTIIELGNGGSVVLISSIGGLVGFSHLGHYTAAKHGVTGLMRALSVELAPHRVRCNSVHPGTVDSPMLSNPIGYEFWTGVAGASREDAAKLLVNMNALPVPWVEEIDVSNLVLFLASDEARYITGTTQVVDAGATAPFKIPHA